MYQPKPHETGGYTPGDDKPGGDPIGKCKCEKWPLEVPNEDQPFRRFLLALKEAIQGLSAEAIKKFEDELKDAEKESQGIPAVVAKYKEFYDKLDCRLAEAKGWKEEIARSLTGKIDQPTADAITEFRKQNYDDVEKKICCDWIALRDRLNKLRDCQEQAKRTEEERKQDYDDLKSFEKTLGDRFTQLKTLFDQAKALAMEQRYQGVFAVSLEYGEIYDNLGLFRDWAYARSQCPPPENGYGEPGEPEEPPPPPEGEYGKPEPPPPPPPPLPPLPDSGGYSEQPTPQPPPPPESGWYDQGGGGLKTEWPPDKFKKRLSNNLRELVLAKYQRFRWQHELLTKTADTDKGETACKDFRKERQKQFIEEADDVPTPEPTGGGSDDYGQKPSTDGYPETSPTGGDYEQKPPAGNNPDKPSPPYGGQDTPAQQPDTHPGRQKY